jgi:hypothetical protein
MLIKKGQTQQVWLIDIDENHKKIINKFIIS